MVLLLQVPNPRTLILREPCFAGPILGPVSESASGPVPPSRRIPPVSLWTESLLYSAKDLVNQILSFSRMGEEKLMAPVDVSRIAREAISLLRASLPGSIEIRKGIQKVMILADATQIHQVIVNWSDWATA